MKKRLLKTRNRFGVPEYQEYVDMDGIIAIALHIAAAQSHNTRAQELVAWLATLGRKPTAAEFKAWLEAHGVQLQQAEVEPYEN